MNVSSVNFNFPQNQIQSLPKEKEISAANQSVSKDISDVNFGRNSKTEPKTESKAAFDKVAAANTAPSIIVMRENGLETLVSMIDEAKESIDVQIYIMTANTKELMDSLKGALNRGVKVRLMVEDDPFYWKRPTENPSEKAVNELVKHGAEYKPDNPVFSKSKVTHQKSIIFDGEKGLILTGNLGSSTFGKNLDIGAVIVENPKTVGQMQTIFESDWDRVKMPDLGETDLVLSPDNSRERLTGLLNGAKQSIKILQQGFTDKEIIDLLAQKQQDGVGVDLMLTDPGIAQGNMQSGAYLALKGADVKFMVDPYIHAKAVGIDSGTVDSKTYIGSQNFSQTAIDKNRELGYIFHDKNEQLDGILDRYKNHSFQIPSSMVITDPTAIGTAVKSAIRTAEKEVIVQTNLFSEGGVKNALKAAAAKGVDTTVMMPSNPFPWDPNCTTNLDTKKELEKAGVKVIMTDPTYKTMQGTCLLVDGKESITFPDNLSASAFKYNNSFGVIGISEKDVTDLSGLLKADISNMSYTNELNPTSNIVASPGNARQRLENLINGAGDSLKIATKSLNDTKMIELIKKKAKEGVEAFVIIGTKNLSSKEQAIIKDLRANGVHVSNMRYDTLANNYIEVDGENAYIGSHSFVKKSLEEDRGFGNIVSHPEMLRIARGKFSDQWLKASIQNADEVINVKMPKIDLQQDFKELLISAGKRGVKVRLSVNDFETSYTKAEFAALNLQIREMAKKAADTEEAKQEIAKFFGEPFDIEKGLKVQKKVASIISGLRPGEEIFNGTSDISIKQKFISVDGKELKILPSREEELGQRFSMDPEILREIEMELKCSQ